MIYGKHQILQGDVLDRLATLTDGSVQCCVTSPPYWGLRDYGVDGQVGLEPSPDAYVAKMVEVFREVRRVLRDDGTLWLNLGTSYWGGGRGGNPEDSPHQKQATNRGSVGASSIDPTRSPRGPRVPSCGTDGTELQDSPASGRACPCCGGELQVGFPNHRDHTWRISQPHEQCEPQHSPTAHDIERSDSETASPPASSLSSRRPTTRASFRRDRAACVPAATDEASPSTRPTSRDGASESFGSSAYTSDTETPHGSLVASMLGTVLSCVACGYSTIKTPTYKPKDLLLLPWLVVFALQQDGWYLRSQIVWAKKSPMPESVTDRPTSSWEPIFLLAKSERYFFDAEAIKEKSVDRESIDGRRPRGQHAAQATGDKHFATSGGLDGDTLAGVAYPTRNCRNVWHLSPEYFREAHFATFPTEIPRRCILAGTSEKGRCPTCGNPWNRVVERSKVKRERPNDYTKRNGEEGTGNSCANSVAGVSSRTIGWEQGCKCEPHSPVPCVVLDPFSGSGTTGAVACQLGRNYIGIELNPEYVALSERRIGKALRPNAYADNGAAAIEDGLFA